MSIAGYEYRKDGGSPVDVGNVLSKLVTGLTADTDYAFEVRAYDHGGNRSPWATAIPSPVHTPAGPASPIDPETLSSFKSIVYAEDVSQSDNTALNLWNDRTTNNKDMTGPPSGGNSPKFHTSGGPGGSGALDKCVQFDGLSQWFDWADFSAFTEAEIFLVVKLDADPPPSPNHAFFDLGASGVHSNFIPYDANEFYEDFFSTSRQHGVGGAWASRPNLASQWRIVNMKSKNGLFEIRIDDTVVFTTATNTFGAPTGTTKFGWANQLLKGKVTFVGLSNGVLSTGNHAGVYSFIKSHFGL